jgi:serine/threonine protein kinase
MAVVYLAYDPNFRRNVAIKLVSGNFQDNSTYRERFEREAHLIARIEHPAIVPVYDYGEQNNQLYLVMRHMPGGSLADKLKEGALTLGYATQVLAQVAPALDAVHSQGIVHRDLKPANILFDGFGNPAISDFGIAHFTTATSDLTGSAVIGTPSYMSPEQVRADADLDGRSDVYALGVILFEMLTGRGPFQANSPMSVALKHLTDALPSIRAFRPDLPTALESILGKALAKDREMRYEKASDLASALRALPEAARDEGMHADVRVASARGDAVATEVDSKLGTPPRIPDPEVAQPRSSPIPSVQATPRKSPSRILQIAVMAGIAILLLFVCGSLGVFGTWAGLSNLFSPEQTLFSDDFSNPQSGWPSDQTQFGQYGYQAERYRILAIGEGSVPWVSRDGTYDNLSLYADATPISGNGYYGLLCRIQNDRQNFYYFVLGSDGSYDIGKLRDGEIRSLFADGTRYSDSINQGNQTNRIRADCTGSTLRLYANDVLLDEATDTDFSSGKSGMSVSASDTQGFEVIFDNFLVTTPGQ